jgi:hypothetical protein
MGRCKATMYLEVEEERKRFPDPPVQWFGGTWEGVRFLQHQFLNLAENLAAASLAFSE